MPQYTALACNAASCIDVVTSYHADCYTRTLTLADGIRNLYVTQYQSLN